MGLNSAKFALANTECSLILSSSNHVYRALTTIEGEFHLNTRTKLRIEKKIRVDLVGRLIEKTTHTDQIFFTYSYPLVTSHQNGIARTIKQQKTTFSFRIPLGINLPPSCEFEQFSITYYLDVYHDGRLLPNLRTKVILAPPIPLITIPVPCQTTGLNDMTMICTVERSFYSGHAGTVIPLSISIIQPKSIQSIVAQLIQIVSLNGRNYEKEILTVAVHELQTMTQDSQISTLCELNLPSDLSPTYTPNENNRPDNVPSITITYLFRVAAQMKEEITPSLHLTIPLGIE